MQRQDVSSLLRELVGTTDAGDELPATPEPVALRLFQRLVEQARRLGVAMDAQLRGPWRATIFHAPFAVAFGPEAWPVVQCGGFMLAMPTERMASELAALLNWCDFAVPVP